MITPCFSSLQLEKERQSAIFARDDLLQPDDHTDTTST
jgi:hypothetical protein